MSFSRLGKRGPKAVAKKRRSLFYRFRSVGQSNADRENWQRASRGATWVTTMAAWKDDCHAELVEMKIPLPAGDPQGTCFLRYPLHQPTVGSGILCWPGRLLARLGRISTGRLSHLFS
jgi:hypothetical protein